LALAVAGTRMRPVSREFALITLGTAVLLADAAASALASGLALPLIWGGSALAFAALLGARPRPEAATPPAAATAEEAAHTAAGTTTYDDAAATAGTTTRAAGTAGTTTCAAATAGTITRDAAGSPAGEASTAPRHPAVARAADALLDRGGVADWVFAAAGLVVQLALAVSHVLTFEAPPEALSAAPDATALVSAGAIAVVTFGCARLADRTWEVALDALALAAVAFFTALALDGWALTVAYAAEAIALALVFRPGATALAGLALAHAVAVLAPPSALLDGLENPLQAAVGLLAATTALAAATRSRAATALALLYLASVQVVTAGGPEHTGQTLLSVLWALAGVGTLVYGLLRDERPAREGALVLLAVTAGKVFLYDLSELDSLARVASFIGFGLLLLAGAFVWQRVRPRAVK
jgi:hypothetical protein